MRLVYVLAFHRFPLFLLQAGGDVNVVGGHQPTVRLPSARSVLSIVQVNSLASKLVGREVSSSSPRGGNDRLLSIHFVNNLLAQDLVHTFHALDNVLTLALVVEHPDGGLVVKRLIRGLGDLAVI